MNTFSSSATAKVDRTAYAACPLTEEESMASKLHSPSYSFFEIEDVRHAASYVEGETKCRPLYVATTSAPNSVQLGPKSDCHGASENLFTERLVIFQNVAVFPEHECNE